MANGILNMTRGLGHITGPGPDRAGLHPSTTAREPPPRRRGQRDDADVIKQLRRARLVGRACERGPYLFHDLAGTADAAEQRPSTPAGAAPARYLFQSGTPSQTPACAALLPVALMP